MKAGKCIKKVAGVLLVIGGVIGLFLPFLQGIAMIVAGLALLGNKRALLYSKKLKQWWQNKKKFQSLKK